MNLQDEALFNDYILGHHHHALKAMHDLHELGRGLEHENRARSVVLGAALAPPSRMTGMSLLDKWKQSVQQNPVPWVLGAVGVGVIGTVLICKARG